MEHKLGIYFILLAEMYDMTNMQVSHLYKSEVVHVKLSQLASVTITTCLSLPLTLKTIAAVDSGRA